MHIIGLTRPASEDDDEKLVNAEDLETRKTSFSADDERIGLN